MMKKLSSSVLSQLVSMLVATIVGLAVVPIIISILGKLEYGAFEIILSLVIIDLFLEFGLGSTLVKYIPELKTNPYKLRTFVWSYFYIKLFLTFICFCIVLLLGYNFDLLFNVQEIPNIQQVKLATYIFAISLFIKSAATFLDAFLKGFVYFGIVNISKSVSQLLFFIIIYTYYKLCPTYSIIDVAVIWFILRPVFLLFLFMLNIYYLKLSYILKPALFNLEDIKSTIKYMFGMTYIVMLAQLYNRSPKIIIGVFVSPIHVAYWAIMEKIKAPLLQLQSSLLRPLIPILSNKDNFAKMTEKKILQLVRLEYLFISFLSIMTLVHAELFIQLWLGNGYELTINLIYIIFLSFLFPRTGVFLMMYYAEGKTKINAIFVTANSVVSLIVGALCVFLTKDVKLLAFSLSFVLIIMTLANVFRYTKYFNISNLRYIKDAVLSPVLIIISFLTIHYFFIDNYIINVGFFDLFISVLISLIVYCVLFFIFMKKDDRELINKILKIKNKRNYN